MSKALEIIKEVALTLLPGGRARQGARIARTLVKHPRTQKALKKIVHRKHHSNFMKIGSDKHISDLQAQTSRQFRRQHASDQRARAKSAKIIEQAIKDGAL